MNKDEIDDKIKEWPDAKNTDRGDLN